MELHQLRYVLAVADTGTFTAAAARLRVSQSGVSTQVQKLERELGVALFDRGSRQVAVTGDGARMLPSFRAALAAVEAIREQASDLRGLIVGSLAVGTVTGLSWPPFFDAITDIHSGHPGVELRLIQATSDELVAQVRSGELDLAVAGWSHTPPAGLETVTVVDDPLIAGVSEGHPWSARKVVRPAELASVDLIALPRGTGAGLAMDEMFVRAGVATQPRWEVATPAFMGRLASRGIGVAIASATTLSDAPGVVALRIDDLEARSRLGIVWRPNPSAAARALLDPLLAAATAATTATTAATVPEKP